MKSLIIGAAGFVGAYLIRHLTQELGHETIVTKLPQEKLAYKTNVSKPVWEKMASLEPDAADVRVFDLDILNQEAVAELFESVRPDYIFHLAAQSSVAVSWRHPGLTVDVNVRGAVHVLEALRRLGGGTRMLLIGSGEEYGHVLPEEIPIREENPVKPGNIYAATKACQNMLGSIYAQAYGLEVMMVRAFNHIGPNQEPLFVAADFCRQAALIEAGKKEPVIQTGNLDVRRDFTDVRDVVRAYAMIAEYGKAGETYNVGSGKAVKLADMLQMILEKSWADISVETDRSKLRPVDLPVIEADIHKLQEITGWEPVIGLEQTIEETLDYWRMQTE